MTTKRLCLPEGSFNIVWFVLLLSCHVLTCAVSSRRPMENNGQQSSNTQLIAPSHPTSRFKSERILSVCRMRLSSEILAYAKGLIGFTRADQHSKRKTGRIIYAFTPVHICAWETLAVGGVLWGQFYTSLEYFIVLHENFVRCFNL